MSFRAWQFLLHLYYVTSYFVLFVWKNLQNEYLYTLIPVHISCCTHSVTNGTSSLLMSFERVLVACTYKLRQITPAAYGSHRTTTIFDRKRAISNCI